MLPATQPPPTCEAGYHPLMRHRLLLLLVPLALFACGSSDDTSVAPSPEAGADASPDAPGSAGGSGGSAGSGGNSPDGSAGQAGGAPLSSVTFQPSDEVFPNPERGFYDFVDLTGGGDFQHVRQNGRTLAYAGVHLDAFRDGPIDSAFLDALSAGFAQARTDGIKLVLRFVYNDDMGEPDASKVRVLAHIGQLTPVLASNQDVIAVLQAGLIGAWGEWHSSTNGLDNPADRHDIVAALLDAVPSSRMVQIRTPMYKEESFGGPLADANAFDGSQAARIGHHNDCFLATDDDMGTYEDPIGTWKAFVAQEGRFTPVGGETCAVNAPRSECASATAEMQELHWSFLNALYHPDVIAAFESGGCLQDIQRRLGYRIALQNASFSSAVAPGGELTVRLTLQNEGYSAFYNPRPVVIVLQDGTRRLTAELAKVDPRRWEPGNPIVLETKLRIPADVQPGDHRLSLWLPDAQSTLRDRPEYSVRIANAGVWDAASGDNELTKIVKIDPSAPGPVDATAKEFVEIP